MSSLPENHEVRVKGTVQGVGFRPAVYRLALDCQLRGEVSNDSEGVLIRLTGMQSNIRHFLSRLQNEAPPLARIDSIMTAVVDDTWSYQNFRIAESIHSHGRTEVASDAATCQACLAEMSMPLERRFLYPFTNCTHCGPRLSIVQGIPYDRSMTTMAAFAMCPQCQQEYSDPLDRRFHAQPVACHVCGPQLIVIEAGQSTPRQSAINTRELQEHTSLQLQQIQQALMEGKIIAVKGLGGFHLCCDASNHDAVQTLRERKRRYAKPFAVMAHDMACIKQYCQVSQLEVDALQSSAAPIVLLESLLTVSPAMPALSAAIAPGSRLLGFMLPYTPLHHMICRQFGRPLVMTSGNVSGEPQITGNEEAIEKLSKIADLIVCHNRDIANRIDDSVVRCVAGKVRVLRRARGYAPRSITLPSGFEEADGILAYGAELKSTFCLIKQGSAVLSQHQGDLEDLDTLGDYEHNLALFQQLFEITPLHMAQDLHPEYMCNKLTHNALAATRITEVQHHHAHIASVMAENHISLSHGAVLGVALDGLGLGDDGKLWGGEFLLADYCSFQRLASLKPVAMPGAAQSIKQPWRNSLAHILDSMPWDVFQQQFGDTELARFLNRQAIATLKKMLTEGINSPLASSTGRLFDAVAGALGIHTSQVQFEGQAAMELEMLVDKGLLLDCLAATGKHQAYDFHIEQIAAPNTTKPPYLLTASMMWPQLLRDVQQGASQSLIATRFHAGLIKGITNMVSTLRQSFTFHDVALSGGCLQNAVLLEGLESSLHQLGLNCLTHSVLPANDGGLALGQAVVAAARMAALITAPTTAPISADMQQTRQQVQHLDQNKYLSAAISS